MRMTSNWLNYSLTRKVFVQHLDKLKCTFIMYISKVISKMHYYTYAFMNIFFSDVRKKGSTELKRLVSIVRSKNRKKIASSNDRLKLQSQESPKVQEVANNATTSKASNSSMSLVNYDNSSTDSDT